MSTDEPSIIIETFDPLVDFEFVDTEENSILNALIWLTTVEQVVYSDIDG